MKKTKKIEWDIVADILLSIYYPYTEGACMQITINEIEFSIGEEDEFWVSWNGFTLSNKKTFKIDFINKIKLDEYVKELKDENKNLQEYINLLKEKIKND